MILISFIIINFNNSDYLKKLLIGFHGFNTRYSFEVILIDDKSTDDSLNIAQYGLKHIKNFTFIQNEINSGLVYSWKYALDKSNGKYIFFIDSDDAVIFKNFETMFELLLKYDDCDIFIFQNSVNFVPNKNYKPLFLNEGLINKEKIRPFLSSRIQFFNKVQLTRWAKVYKKELIINDLDMINNGLTIGDDAVANTLWFSKAEKIIVKNLIVYDYNIRNQNSIMRSKRTNYINKILLIKNDLFNICNKYPFVNMNEINFYLESQLVNYTHYYFFRFNLFKGLKIIVNSLSSIYIIRDKIKIKTRGIRSTFSKGILNLLLYFYGKQISKNNK